MTELLMLAQDAQTIAVSPAPSPVASIIEAIGDNFFWFAIAAIAISAILFEAVRSMVNNNARERSRREIAAYIAEGSMTPDQGERLMRAVPDANG